MSTESKSNVDTGALRMKLETSVETGQVSAAAAFTLTQAAKRWVVNSWRNYLVEITAGNGKGEFAEILANTADTLTIDHAWTVIPDDRSHYRILVWR